MLLDDIFHQDLSLLKHLHKFDLLILIVQANNTNINERDVWKEDTSNEEIINDINGDIEFHNVNFHYPSRKDVSALHNISFVVPAGQTTALVGSSGCGMLFLLI